jgi:hypothetical protein
MATSIKISQLPAKGSNLEATDLLEVSEFNGTGYVSKSITGQEIIDSVPSSVTAWGTITGTLSAQTDLNTALSGKQATVTLTTTGTGAATFVSNVLNVPTPAAATFSSLTTTGSSGASTLTSGVLNVPTYSLSGLGGVPTTRTLTINGTTQDLSADRTFTISTGITIGTTAITSGTVGRVLFEGTGNVVQESANLFWDNTNGRLGIGTSSPSQKLDVVGIIKGTTSAVGTMLDINGVTNSAFNVINDSSGRTFLTVKGNPSATSIGGAFITGEGFQEAWCNVIARQASAGNQYWRFGNLGSNNYFAIQKLNDTATAITLTALTAFSSTGNVGINTTTDAGFKLDVNGTARVQTSLAVTTGKTFSAYTTGSTANDALKLTASTDGAVFGIHNSNALGFSGIEYLNAAGTSQVFTGFNNNNNQEFRFNNFATGGYIDFRIGGTSSLRIFNSRNVGINTTTDIASSQFQIDSTTKGFLPPRMTTTQKNAIATPSAGLMVYDTTLNLMALYNGTVWTTL